MIQQLWTKRNKIEDLTILGMKFSEPGSVYQFLLQTKVSYAVSIVKRFVAEDYEFGLYNLIFNVNICKHIEGVLMLFSRLYCKQS